MSYIKAYYDEIIDKAWKQTGIDWGLLNDIFYSIILGTDTQKAIEIFDEIIKRRLDIVKRYPASKKFSIKIIVNGELFFTNELSVEEIEQLKKFLENNREVLRYGGN